MYHACFTCHAQVAALAERSEVYAQEAQEASEAPSFDVGLLYFSCAYQVRQHISALSALRVGSVLGGNGVDGIIAASAACACSGQRAVRLVVADVRTAHYAARTTWHARVRRSNHVQ